MIEIADICKAIEGRPILKDISLKIRKRRNLTLIGPSGCGKTTLLRLIAGLEKPDAGEITIDGKTASGSGAMLPPRKRRIGMIFQDLALWPHMTVRQHLVYVTRHLQNEDNGNSPGINGLLDAVDLISHSERYPHQLSGGEQQRLAIVRALAQKPRYLLMDEPFSNLDPILKAELVSLIAGIQKKSEIGIIHVSHNIRDFVELSDQVAVMKKGRLIQSGNKSEIIDHPADHFVEKMMQV